MVTNDNIDINIRFNTVGADGLSKVSNDIKVFKSGVDGAKTSVDGFDRVIQKFSVQTFAQGLLNISTSAAQVYTSFSNLDRAANQVQASLVAMHKAEDQIERKQIQLTKAIDQYGISSEKAAMINEELATAEEQLAVKTERHRLAVDQLRDTQILMVSNLVNTGFGALQTITSLHNMLTSSLKGNTVATGVNTAAKVLSGAATTGSAAGLATATAAQVANTGATAAAVPVHLALGAAIRANPLFLPATLATIGIGIAATAYTVSQMSQSTKDLTESVNGSSGAIDGLTGSYDSNLPSATSFGSSVSSNTTIMEDFTEKINEMNNKIIENNKVLSQNTIADKKFKGRFASGISKEETEELKKENEKTARTIAFENQKMIGELRNQVLIDNVKTGALSKSELVGYGLLTAEHLKEQKNIISHAIEDISILTKDSLIDENTAMKLTIKTWGEKGVAIGMSKKELEAAIIAQRALNNEETKGAKDTIKYLKEIAELKKKTSQRYIKELGTSLGRNLKDSIFGLSDPMLEFLTGKTSSELGYIPFAGKFDKALKNIKQSIDLAQTSNQLFGQVGLLEQMYSILPALEPGTDEYKQVNNAIKQVQRNIDSIQKAPNITGRIRSIAEQITVVAGKAIKLGDKDAGVFRNIGGGVGSLMGNVLSASAITGQQASKPGKVLSLLGLSQTSTARNTSSKALAASLSMSTMGSKAYGKKLTTAKGGRKRKGHSSKPQATPEEYFTSFFKISSSSVAELSRLSGVDIMAGMPDPMSYIKAQQYWSNHISPRNPNFMKELQAWNSRTESYQKTMNDRIAQANSIISSGRSLVGQGISDLELKYGFDVVVDQEVVSKIESTLGYRDVSAINVKEQLLGVLAGDEKYYNVDDRLRFTDKLAQISTGATVI